MMASRYLVGVDGRTAFERRRGRKCNVSTVPFGEVVNYKEIREGKEHVNKMDTEWKEGVWLGHARGSNEILVGTRDGVVRAYSVIRKPEGERWNRVLLQEMQGTPQQPDPNKQSEVIPIKIRFDPPGEGEIVERKLPKKRTVRRMRLEQTMFEDYGYTEG